MDMDRRELLEIYKLHAELADRISQRREGANRLYVSLLAAISALLAASLRIWNRSVSCIWNFNDRRIIGNFTLGIMVRCYPVLSTTEYRQIRDSPRIRGEAFLSFLST